MLALRSSGSIPTKTAGWNALFSGRRSRSCSERVVIKNICLLDASEWCQVFLESGRKLTDIKQKVLRRKSRIHQRRPHIIVTGEEPSPQNKIPVKWSFRAKPVIQRIWIGDGTSRVAGQRRRLALRRPYPCPTSSRSGLRLHLLQVKSRVVKRSAP